MTRIEMRSASVACTAMSSFARGDSGIVSVGLKPVEFVVDK
jgi:hypothetical protein